MATRFYPTTDIYYYRIDVDPEWDLVPTMAPRRRSMFPWRGGMQTPSDASAGESTTATNLDALIYQFVGPPLAAQTISGTVEGVFFTRQNSTAADLRSQMVVWVVAPDNTVRGTLIPADTGGLSNEWFNAASGGRSTYFPVGSTGTTVTDVDVEDGDRIVVELGWRVHNTIDEAGTSTGFIRIGSNFRDADAPQNQTTTTNTADYPWIEFSQNLTFLNAPLTLSDTLAGAPEAMPDPLGEVIVETSAFDTFTGGGTDPTEFELDTGLTDPPSGWLKLTASGSDAHVSMYWTAGYNINPWKYVYTSSPGTGSTATYVDDYDNSQHRSLVVPDGETWYIAVVPSNITFADTNVAIILRREDSDVAGDITDDIGDAIDCFPSAENTELDSSGNIVSFTTEADDPTEVATYTGYALGHTGWMKLVVLEEALVTITTTICQPLELMFWLYDEVPTSSSVAIHSDKPGAGELPELTEILLPAGTYYLLVAPFRLDTWGYFEGGAVTVRVRWEQGPIVEDFSMDAVIFKTNTAPDWVYIQPTLVDSVSGTVDDATSMDITIPGTAAESDIFLIQASVDSEGVAQTVSMSLLLGAVASGNTLTALGTSTVATNNHILQSRWCRWNGTGDTIRITSTNSTAKAAVLSIWRDAGTPDFQTSTNVSTVILSGKTATSFGVTTSDPNYGKSMTLVNAWAGGRAGVTTWTLGTPQVEIEDVSATANANLVVGYRTNTVLDTFVEPVFATPSAAEFTLIHTISIVPASYDFTLRAVIIPGFTFNAYIREVTHTTHLRTGPHTGTHLDTAVVTSALLGSLPAGTDLNTVLADLDAQITDLENQA